MFDHAGGRGARGRAKVKTIRKDIGGVSQKSKIRILFHCAFLSTVQI